MEFEDILTEVGSYGKYQQILVWVLLLPLSFLMAFQSSTPVFQTVVPKHWCHVAKYNDLFTDEEWKNMTIPKNKKGEFESCKRYNIIHEETEFTITADIIDCDAGWEYDKSTLQSTFATSFNWVCDNEIYSAHFYTVRLGAKAVSMIILPAMADHYTGRRSMLFYALIMNIVFLGMVPWVPWSWALLAVQGLLAFPAGIVYQMCYVIVVELIATKKRSLVSSLSFQTWTFGMCITALVAWGFPDWQSLAYFAMVPGLMIFPLYKYLPESPRWLLSKMKISESTATLMKVSEYNKIKADRESIENKLKVLSQQKTAKEAPIRLIFQHRTLCLRYLIMLLLACATEITYCCVFFNIDILPNQYFLNFFLLALSEVPSSIGGWLTTQYLGRRTTTVLMFFLASIAGCVGYFVVENKVLLLVMACIIRTLATMAISVNYLYLAELLPTPVRSTATGWSMVITNFSCMLSPYVIAKGETFQYTVISGVTFISAVAGLFLPETLGLPLPQTFNQAENLGKDRPFFSVIHHWNVKQYEMIEMSPKSSEEVEKD